MQIQHITHYGSSLLRDSASIELLTLETLKEFQFFGGVKTLDFPITNFKVKVTSTSEGAIFDIIGNGGLAITNFCCFRAEQKESMVQMISDLTSQLPVQKSDINLYPDYDHFIYSIIINPFALDFSEVSVAGEIELYIYYSLFLAQKDKS